MHQGTRATVLVGTFAAAMFALLVTAETASAQSSIKVVVNGEAITSNEIAGRARFLRLVDKGSTGASVERAAMEELVEERLKLQEAKRVGIDASPQQVDGAFGGIAQRLKISPAQLAQGLTQQGIDPNTLKARLKTQIVWQQLVTGRFAKSMSISDSQIVDALAKKEATGKGKPASNGTGATAEYTLQQVVLVVPAQGGNADARMKEAEALRTRINGCDGLVEAVKPLKEALVKSLGKRTEDELSDTYREALANVPVGKLTKPSRSAIGIEMIAVCAKRDVTGDFAIRSKVEEELRNQEGEVSSRRYINDLRRTAVIEYKK